MKTKKYKGYVLQYSKPTIGFFSSGRAGKVKTKIWVTDELGILGQWVNSEAEAKKLINSKVGK